MIQSRIVLVLCIFFFSTMVSASTFFISISSGHNNQDGKSEVSAWKTISEINWRSFLPGDSILFKRGDTWRETLIIPSSGKKDKHIVIGSYGNSGNKPHLLGSKEVSSWIYQGGNIWKSVTRVEDPYNGFQAEIIFIKSDGNSIWGRVKKNNIESLAQEFDWCWVSNYIYIYAASDPGSRYAAVEVPQRDVGISLNDKQYITIDGIDLLFYKLAGIKGLYPAINLNGLSIKNCEIGWIGIKGSPAAFGISMYHSDVTIANNSIHDCGRRGISVTLDGGTTVPVVVQNVTIENNTFYNGFHTTGPDLSCELEQTITNVVIRRNLFYNNPTELIDGVEGLETNDIWLQEYSGTGAISNIYIYDNIFKNVVLKGIGIENITSAFIYNNTFYGFNPTMNQDLGGFVYVGLTGNLNIHINNNLFYGNMSHSVNSYQAGVTIVSGVTIASLNYNLYYQTDPLTSIINWQGRKYLSDWSTYKTASGFDTNSPTPADPLFVSSSDLRVQQGSPAIGAGVAIPEVITDFEGKTFTNPPNIGCFATPVFSNNRVFRSSLIENAAPSLLEMNYLMTLADIVSLLLFSTKAYS